MTMSVIVAAARKYSGWIFTSFQLSIFATIIIKVPGSEEVSLKTCTIVVSSPVARMVVVLAIIM